MIKSPISSLSAGPVVLVRMAAKAAVRHVISVLEEVGLPVPPPEVFRLAKHGDATAYVVDRHCISLLGIIVGPCSTCPAHHAATRVVHSAHDRKF